MLCCSLFAFLLGQCGALAGAAKMRLFGSAGPLASAIGPLLADWSTVRWLTLGIAFATELTVAVAAFPTLYAIDVPQHLAPWPICAAAVRALTGAGR